MLRALDGEPTTGWSNGDAALDDSDPIGSSHRNRVERQAIFIPRVPLGFPDGTRLTIRLRHEGEHPGKTIGRFRSSVTWDQNPTRKARRRSLDSLKKLNQLQYQAVGDPEILTALPPTNWLTGCRPASRS